MYAYTKRLRLTQLSAVRWNLGNKMPKDASDVWEKVTDFATVQNYVYFLTRKIQEHTYDVPDVL